MSLVENNNIENINNERIEISQNIDVETTNYQLLQNIDVETTHYQLFQKNIKEEKNLTVIKDFSMKKGYNLCSEDNVASKKDVVSSKKIKKGDDQICKEEIDVENNRNNCRENKLKHSLPPKLKIKKERDYAKINGKDVDSGRKCQFSDDEGSLKEEDHDSTLNDYNLEQPNQDMMETSPIECEVQIKTEPIDQDISADPGLYNGEIGDDEIYPGIHVIPRPFVYDPDDTYRKAKKLELEKLQVEKAPRHACDHCDRIFYLQSKLKKHMQSHLEERPYPCPVCGSSHKTDYDLKSHLITHSNQRPYVCPECPASFKRPSSLKSHLHVHSPVRSFACNECKANFKRKSDLLSHMPLHSEVRPFSCNKCQALFKTEKGLKCHIKTHDNRPMTVRRRPRNTSAELARISELVNNDPSMTPGKDRYVCNECFVEFNKRETLIKHMLVHSSVREFSCPQCTKTFKRRADLRSHMTVHSDYKPYSCQYCTATFKRTIEVKFHMRVHASPVQYTCTVCHVVFKSKVQLSRHRSTVHNQPNYRNHCTMCEQSFRTKPELNQHLLAHCQRLQEIKEEAES